MNSIEKYQLQDIEEGQLEVVLKWRNSEHIRKYMYSDDYITFEDHVNWFKNIKKDTSKIAKLLMYDGNPIGFVQFTNIDERNSKCYWGFYIGEKNAPPGSGTALGLLALHYIFEEFPIRKLCAEVLDFNTVSLNYHKKFGFIEEGRFIKHVFKNDRYVDVISMALFKDKWSERKQILTEG
ncbi:UDP-4-amino-4,6-dideoxy-N-acetyl-beta-L-altrosamine N-acetyltransferase [Bacillus oleivorans]|uniref:UDP-4-amino-4,6-dideoxy-N-acetyl-beta-L-altrosamine N-acetyltransferase n=1 Tax=Bacillus oleivorans TaxID=1448271 RepID=A0A285D6H9_9BACI|nr:UDP-4-amino-4,6-dideoxy-N-acetyl-beta-L-altrosamine N-acetyltransferase [Bacillus oleivorans]SNX74858.1 UDP-4-amino-4,6-dideoxy-N-acetyl-beta-L-altrosamine N-acetyltransferase [Bacillus oleivorans]